MNYLLHTYKDSQMALFAIREQEMCLTAWSNLHNIGAECVLHMKRVLGSNPGTWTHGHDERSLVTTNKAKILKCRFQ